MFSYKKGGEHVVFTGHYVTSTDNKGQIMTAAPVLGKTKVKWTKSERQPF